MLAAFLLLTGLLALALLLWLRRTWLCLPVLPIASLLLVAGVYLCWYEHRPVPPAIEETWFEGISYARIVRQQPRPLVIHVVTIDLDAEGIDFLVTPPELEGEHPLRGQTTSAFLERHQLQVAINGSFFFPWHSHGPFDYYPRVGDPVSVHGLAMSNGRIYSPRDVERSTLFLTGNRRAVIGSACPDARHALSGLEVFLRKGEFALSARNTAMHATHEPRTVVALSKDERKLLLVVIDGRQPNYSEGVTLEELAAILREFGGWTALHLDGGGSSTLVRQDENGRPSVVNSPIHGRHPPGRERPVANHLGVFAKPITRR